MVDVSGLDRDTAKEVATLLLRQFQEADAWLGTVHDSFGADEQRQVRLCIGTIMGEIQLTGLMPLFRPWPGLEEEVWNEALERLRRARP